VHRTNCRCALRETRKPLRNAGKPFRNTRKPLRNTWKALRNTWKSLRETRKPLCETRKPSATGRVGPASLPKLAPCPPVGDVDIPDPRMVIPVADIVDWQIELTDGSQPAG